MGEAKPLNEEGKKVVCEQREVGIEPEKACGRDTRADL